MYKPNLFDERALMDFKTKQVKDFMFMNYGVRGRPEHFENGKRPYYVYNNVNKMMKLNGTYKPEKKLRSTGSIPFLSGFDPQSFKK